MFKPIHSVKPTTEQLANILPGLGNDQSIIKKPLPLLPWDITLQRLHTELRRSSEDYKFRCIMCPEVFSVLNKYTDHLALHRNKPFDCTICFRSFPRKVELTRHALVHTREKRFCCPECYRLFSRRDHMKKHLGTHLFPKPDKDPKQWDEKLDTADQGLVHQLSETVNYPKIKFEKMDTAGERIFPELITID